MKKYIYFLSCALLITVSSIGQGGPSKNPPSVKFIHRQEPAEQVTDTTTVIFKISFSENVTGVNRSDFQLVTESGNVEGTVSNLDRTGGNDKMYEITVSSITGSGTLRLDLKSSGTSIKDFDGNNITGGFNTGQTYIIKQQSQPPPPQIYGFASVNALNPVAVGDGTDTQHKPQGKTWFYAGKWWSVLTISTGTKVFRLDGTTWTEALHVFNSGGRADCWVVGNLVHILLHRNTLASPLISLEYDATNNTYKRWSQRPSNSTITFPTGSETATLTVDGTGRLWAASAEVDEVQVWYTDVPYSTWSGPITIATGIQDDDICAITKLPGKIGVFWSNQTTGVFGFKTHTDGTSATQWSTDEIPGSSSVIPGDPRMADDHISLVVASNGILYAAVKTGYTSDALPLVGLLVRQPSGEWSELYTVATVAEDGTQPIVILNEELGKVKVIYTTITNGGDIVYKESLVSAISFGAEKTLIGGAGPIYNFATSTHQPYHPEVVILATKVTSPRSIVSVLASDVESPITMRQADASTSLEIKVFPTFIKKGNGVVIQSNSTEVSEVIVSDEFGRNRTVYRFRGRQIVETKNLNTGIHFITVQSNGVSYTRKIMVTD